MKNAVARTHFIETSPRRSLRAKVAHHLNARISSIVSEESSKALGRSKEDSEGHATRQR
ncbi:hypothetical protein M404DRAFT_999478 [Pisolithus tinctorius Marx 270]|uniref:Uncharacterized protein n=1 Tax=Pisolithus tinctorius Marx 270 TaxID=870435 RepID=A0A0C3PDA1_PISTI|nr:hypothetical protein M404DRAFT_999478 [Pisolithus tinctorius Marx 270]